MNKSHGMIVEFMGVCASGKSTLCEALHQDLKARGLPVLKRSEAVLRAIRARNDGFLKNLMKRCPGIIWQRFMDSEYAMEELLCFTSKYAGLMEHIYSALSKHKVEEHERRIILRAFNKNFSETRVLLDNLDTSNIVLMDEGNAHRGYTLYGYFRENISHEEVAQYASLIPVPDMLFFTDTPAVVCEQRISERKIVNNRLSALSLNERIIRLKNGSNTLRLIAAGLSKRGCPVYTIEHEMDINKAQNAIQRYADAIEYLYKKSVLS